MKTFSLMKDFTIQNVEKIEGKEKLSVSVPIFVMRIYNIRKRKGFDANGQTNHYLKSLY